MVVQSAAGKHVLARSEDVAVVLGGRDLASVGTQPELDVLALDLCLAGDEPGVPAHDPVPDGRSQPPGTGRWPVLMQELDELSHWGRTQAVPRLVTGMEPPEPALPTRYEIAVGHEDERRAMSAGLRPRRRAAQLRGPEAPTRRGSEVCL
ncbi:hypothetical protein ABZ815_18895 [Nonomuraea sp. NPDC047529]|uniref:hypothetical protein n=1 Tax=Nonomuraea sp. NPDC047529 TaxID=3155623 RepID=UPI0033DB3B02